MKKNTQQNMKKKKQNMKKNTTKYEKHTTKRVIVTKGKQGASDK